MERLEGRPPGATLEVDGVTKTFRRQGRKVHALAGVHLHVGPGEFVSLLGPSGCGKSTLLNVIAGILRCDAGSVTVDGQPVTGPGPDRGMLFQSPMLFPWLTTRENVLFGPRAQAFPEASKAEYERQAEVMLDTVGLSGFGDAYPHELSGGMRHRAAFARALINRPAVLLMDEPFGALDALTRSRMHEFLLDLWSAHRITIVFVTHDIEEAILLGDRVCLFEGQPARIEHDIRVPLPRPRNVEDADAPEFIDVKRHVRGALAGALAAQEPRRAP